MSGEFDLSSGLPAQEMAQYLQMYLDETGEQLDGLIEALLLLESRPNDVAQLNEAFRLVHSIKGSSAMMGLDGITVLTHHLENHFERLRSGMRELDQASMDLILRCIDFLRECNRRLRAGQALSPALELLEELNLLQSGPEPAATTAAAAPLRADVERSAAPPAPTSAAPVREALEKPAESYRITVRFEAGLALVDLKAELVLARLGETGAVHDTLPNLAEIAAGLPFQQLQVLLTSDQPPTALRAAADVDGVELVEVEPGIQFAVERAFASADPASKPNLAAQDSESAKAEAREVAGASPPALAAETTAAEGKPKVVETVRVDIERLDNLMNLAGELVVNKARFVQIAREMSPAFRKSNLSGRARAFGESMRRALQLLRAEAAKTENSSENRWVEQLPELEAEIEALEQQSRLWDESRRCYGQIVEAVDQMTRVSDSLQRGVLDTRMVPVAPLFNRFKRVVRDIALELNKRVQLELRGENTELDKRMIDELGDPLVHLVRNAIDHGIEPVEIRRQLGKPEVGTLRLEATHSGNNVLISVRDDGGGLPIERIRRRIVERGLLAADAADDLPERDVIDYIWHPGFSTAQTVSGISGRGVGMDIVKTRIAELSGAIDVEHEPGRGATFTIRLPLTLAIIRSLLFRVRQGIFAVPIESVREIVSVGLDQIISIHGRQTFDVRGEFIPLVGLDDVFTWHGIDDTADAGGTDSSAGRVNVIILHSGGKKMGLRVSELQGGQDIVIKSLAENFIHIRGLSGASILGDGTVCLLLDVNAAIAMAADPRRHEEHTARVST